MRSYKRWWRLNDKKPTFSIPYKQVALCISYICGKKVEDWADEQQEAMDQKLTCGYTVSSKTVLTKLTLDPKLQYLLYY